MCLIATEDALSEAVAFKLLERCNLARERIKPLREGGFGYLKSHFGKFVNAARNGRHVFMLTDLDNRACVSSLLSDWQGGTVIPENFLFRVAVREVESWLVGDRMQLAMFFGISAAKIQLHPESIPHPKEYLLRLAASAKAEIRRDLLPKDGALALQGFGYNERLTDFVDNFWSPTRAGAVSPSLKKAISRLETWMTTIPPTQRV